MAIKPEKIINGLVESIDVEAKNWLNGLASAEDKVKLVREIIALANHGHGFIFIGFDDDTEPHEPIEPSEDEKIAFRQDNITSLVERYIEPKPIIYLQYSRQEGGVIDHPVIEVFRYKAEIHYAKRGIEGTDPLLVKMPYIRRQGAQSSPLLDRDDWDSLVNKLVRARLEVRLGIFFIRRLWLWIKNCL